MIKMIMDMLTANDWINSGSQEIEIAKGRNELPTTFKGIKEKTARKWQSKR